MYDENGDETKENMEYVIWFVSYGMNVYVFVLDKHCIHIPSLVTTILADWTDTFISSIHKLETMYS